MAELQLPTLSVEISADGSGAIREMQGVASAAQSAGSGMSQMGASAEEASASVQTAAEKVKSLSESMQKVGSTMTKTVTTPIVAAFTAATKGAADLTETVSKTEVVFGDYYAQIDQWSQSSIETMGVARSTALEMASLYGDMATGMGFGQEAAADMATELSSLAADMASFKNISIDTAETALKSVFTGETESLKNLGIVMTEANLEAYALSQGITTAYSSMSQAEKVTLRYNYVMEQSKNAQGDFARTGDSLSNQFRKLTQSVKQLGEDFGNLLMPYVSRVVTGLQNAVSWLTNLDEGTKNTILTIGAVVAAVGPMLLVGAKVLKLITSIKTALAVATLNPILLAITGAVAAATLLVSAFKNSATEIDKASESYQSAKAAIEQGISTEVTVDASQLDELDGRNITVTFETKQSEDSDTAAWETFHSEVTDLGWESKTFHATGEFEVSETTTENINAYADALFAAASATEKYDDAVENLNSLLEQEMNRQIQEIQTQATAKIRDLAIAANSGAMTNEEYEAEVAKILQDVKDQTAAIQEETEAQKELNGVLNNGTASDDATYLAQQARQLYGGETISTEDMQGALAYLNELKSSGGDMSEGYTEAGVALAGLQAQSEDVFNRMTTATDDYNAAMEKAAEKEQEAAENTALADMASKTSDALNNFAPFMKMFGDEYDSTSAALDAFVANMAEASEMTDEEAAQMKSIMTNLFADENGELPEDYWSGIIDQISTKKAELDALAADYTATADTASEEAATATEEAVTNYQTAMQQIETDVGLSAEGIQGALVTIEETGVSIPTETKQQIESVAGMLETVNTELQEGTPEVAANVADMVNTINSKKKTAEKNGSNVGKALIDGITSGMNSKKGILGNAAQKIITDTIQKMKEAGEIHSPSRLTRDLIGKNLIRGITVGMETETPSALSAVKSSMSKIVSGAQSVINRGSYSFPSMALAGIGGGMSFGTAQSADFAAQDTSIALVIKDKVIAQTTSDATARTQTIRARRINRGKGRW